LSRHPGLDPGSRYFFNRQESDIRDQAQSVGSQAGPVLREDLSSSLPAVARSVAPVRAS